MGETKYFLMEVDKLIPYARNARTHSEVQIAQIAASIKEFGFLSPVIISKDNTIVFLFDKGLPMASYVFLPIKIVLFNVVEWKCLKSSLLCQGI